MPRIMESRHVTFDEAVFLGICIDDDEFDSRTGSDASFSPETGSEVSIEISEGESTFSHDDPESKNEQLRDEFEESNDFLGNEGGEDSCRDEEYDDEQFMESTDLTTGPDPDETSNNARYRRYPSRKRKKPSAWYMASSAERVGSLTITTSDEPTLKEALSASPGERDLWMSAIEEEFESLKINDTWYPDVSSDSLP